MSKEAFAVDELSSALKATTPSLPAAAAKGGKGKKKGGAGAADASNPKVKSAAVHDRWTLADESKIDYGYLAKTGGAGDHPNKKSFYITTAINYTNGPAHMGHAYEGTTSDVIARFARFCGDQSVYFVTGSDEHGQKIATTAEESGVKPIDLCNKFVTGFQNLNQRTLVTNDDYIRTTSDRHKRTAQELWKKCNEAGDVYLDKYEGWYNVREETFVTENDAELSNYLDVASGKPLKKVQEASYFFKMSKYKDQLIDHIENVNPHFICPSHHKNQILSRLKGDDLRDLSISRTTFDWGINAPEGFEENHVMYVWMDALSNYLTGINAFGLEEADLSQFWPANVHIIGKDILWFHTVIWPCLLMSANIPLPKKVYAHGFVNDKEGKKMSKSLGNVVDPHDMLDKFHVDTFRWYLTKEAPYGGELSFSEDNVRDMHNSDLCDTLGNAVNRATSLCGKDDFCGGIIPDAPFASPLPEFLENFGSLLDSYREKMEQLELQAGAQLAIQGFRDINGYLAKEEPWKLKGDENKTKRQTVVRTALEAIYVMTHLLMPFLPIGTKAIFEKLGTKPLNLTELKGRNIGELLVVGTKVTSGDVLYEKSLSDEDLNKNAAAASTKKESHAEAQKRKKEQKAQAIAKQQGAGAGDPNQPLFTGLDIRVGKIVKVWNHETAEKLYCEEVDLAEKDAAGPRQITSGLRAFYTLEEMQDRKVLVVCNLKAAKIQGFSSNGMVLAAKSEDGTKVELVSPPDDAPIGERVIIEGLEMKDSWVPLSSAQTKKKKTWDAVSKELKTADGGIATWQGKTIMTSTGPCKVASLVGVPIS